MIPTPPSTCNAPLLTPVAAVVFVTDTTPLAPIVVKLPDAAVPPPIAPLSESAYKAPLIPAPPVTIILPDVVLVDTAPAVKLPVPVLVNAVNLPAAGVTKPIATLSKPPSTSELIVSVPPEPIVVSPAGSIVTADAAPTGDILTVWLFAVKSKLPGKAVGLPASPSVIVPEDDANVKSPTGRTVTCAPG